MRSTGCLHALISAATAVTLIARGADAQAQRAPDTVILDPAHVAELDERAAEVRAACLDTRAPDWGSDISTGVMVIGGVALSIYAVSQPREQRAFAYGFLLGFGGGMLLGGVGLPFSRGIFRSRDPLTHACDVVLAAWPPRQAAVDVAIAARMLEMRGEPDRTTVWIALVVGTAVTGGLIATSAALQSYDLLSLTGGLAAAMGVGWIAMIPTPTRRASIRFRNGGYRRTPAPTAPHIALAPAPIASGAGLAIVGTF